MKSSNVIKVEGPASKAAVSQLYVQYLEGFDSFKRDRLIAVDHRSRSVSL